MKKLLLLIAAVAFFAPASLFAQGEPEVTIEENENTKTIIEPNVVRNGSKPPAMPETPRLCLVLIELS